MKVHLKNKVTGTLALLLVWTSAAGGQSTDPAPATPPSRYETREVLQTRATAATAAGRSGEAFLLRSRLDRGDFQEGDRIVVALQGTNRFDTLQVRSGKLLQFPGMADLSLDGVLRSELQDTIRHHLATYLRNPEVRAVPLLPIAVLGSVTNPGYYYSDADIVLRDVIMRAGGPRADANLKETIIRRGGEIIWQASDVRVALADGLSLDRLHLRAGDEIFVPERRRASLSNVVSIVSSVIALTFAIVQLTN